MADNEVVEVVNEDDQVLYETTLEECKKKGLLHRAVAVFLRNSQGQVLLQRRSISDDWLPGKWTVSCTGHVRAGENPSHGSSRELREELGIAASPAFLFKEVLPKITWSGLTEYEVAYAFDVKSDSKIQIDPGEVDQVRFLTPSACLALIQDRPEDLTPDTIILLQNYLQRSGES